MHLRPLSAGDHQVVLDLLVETFAPFFDQYARPVLGGPVFEHQHGHWQHDYREELPFLQAPHLGRHAVVAQLADGAVTGLVAWRFDDRPRHGTIHLLAVDPGHRRRGTGRLLCEHAIAHLRAGGVEVVEVGTGGDPFHAPARALYEALGLTRIPTAVYLGAI